MKAVVEAPNVALEVYKASLNVLPLVAVKLWVPTRISCLKLVGIADVMAISKLLDNFCHILVALGCE